MLTVQMMIGTVEADRTNGSSQRRYHGYTTGAHRSDAAMGHANASEDHTGGLLLNQNAIRTPTSTASPITSSGAATRSSVANTGSLKRNLRTKVPSEPIGIRPLLKNGTYRSPSTTAARAPSRIRTRLQYSGSRTIGRNFTETASPNARAATGRQRRSSAAKDTNSSSAPTISM